MATAEASAASAGMGWAGSFQWGICIFCWPSCSVFVSCLAFSWELSLVTWLASRIEPGTGTGCNGASQGPFGSLHKIKIKAKVRLLPATRRWCGCSSSMWNWLPAPVRQFSQLLPLPRIVVYALGMPSSPPPCLHANMKNTPWTRVLFSFWLGQPKPHPCATWQNIFANATPRAALIDSLELRCIHCSTSIDP